MRRTSRIMHEAPCFVDDASCCRHLARCMMQRAWCTMDDNPSFTTSIQFLNIICNDWTMVFTQWLNIQIECIMMSSLWRSLFIYWHSQINQWVLLYSHRRSHSRYHFNMLPHCRSTDAPCLQPPTNSKNRNHTLYICRSVAIYKHIYRWRQLKLGRRIGGRRGKGKRKESQGQKAKGKSTRMIFEIPTANSLSIRILLVAAHLPTDNRQQTQDKRH